MFVTEARLRVATEDDSTGEADGRVTATVIAGTDYTVGAGAGSAGVDVLDNDDPATLWSTTMTVADFGDSVGAWSSDLAAPGWSEDGFDYELKRLQWFGSPKDRVRVHFSHRPNSAEALTLHAGALTLALAESRSGRSQERLRRADAERPSSTLRCRNCGA